MARTPRTPEKNAEYARRWRAKNPERSAEIAAKFHEKHPDYYKDWYDKHPEQREKVRLATKAWFEAHPGYSQTKGAERRAWRADVVNTVKDVPCMDCGVKYPYYVMDFDHRPDEIKSFTISRIRISQKSLEALLAEIAKCDVVCSNCHRERTHMRGLSDG